MDETTIKEIQHELRIIRESQIKLEVDVRHHIKRSDNFEDALLALELKAEKQIATIDSKVSKIEIPYKVSLFIIASAGLIAVIAQIISLGKG
jgi:hypothetical protein